MIARIARLAIAFSALAASLPAVAHGADQVWWPNFSADNISFANLDNTGSGGNLSGTMGATAPNDPNGLAFDPAAGRVYWASNNGQKISYANIDGSGAGGDLNTTGASVVGPRGLAIDPAAGRIYWAAAFGASPGIYYANLDNSGGGQIPTGTATVSTPSGVAIDKAANRIYWANANTTTGNKISYANLDGSGGGGDLPTGSATVGAPVDVAVDPAGGKILWANSVIVSDGQKIAFANLDGSGGANLNTTGSCTTCAPPTGVALDPGANRVYWTNAFTEPISFANLDNSGGGGDLNDTGATNNGPTYPAVLRTPVPSGPPAVSGGSVTGSTLSCSQGAWAPNLPGAHLYRVPRTFAFQWTLNGSDIGGATSNTHTASTAGTYACKVSATNAAGTGGPQTSAGHSVSEPPPVTNPPANPPAPPRAKKKCKKGRKGVAAKKCKRKR
jgi:hypothetical protein